MSKLGEITVRGLPLRHRLQKYCILRMGKLKFLESDCLD